jgi:hypothetical protein
MSTTLIPSLAPVEMKLRTLAALLRGLPLDLPSDVYHFNTFSEASAFTSDDLKDFGADGALNRHLERTFAPHGRKDGVVITARGIGLEAVVDVLKNCIAHHPDNVILHKWVDDLVEGAIMAGAYVCAQMPSVFCVF